MEATQAAAPLVVDASSSEDDEASISTKAELEKAVVFLAGQGLTLEEGIARMQRACFSPAALSQWNKGLIADKAARKKNKNAAPGESPPPPSSSPSSIDPNVASNMDGCSKVSTRKAEDDEQEAVRPRRKPYQAPFPAVDHSTSQEPGSALVLLDLPEGYNIVESPGNGVGMDETPWGEDDSEDVYKPLTKSRPGNALSSLAAQVELAKTRARGQLDEAQTAETTVAEALPFDPLGGAAEEDCFQDI